MSFLTAVLGAYGGFGAGRQQKQQYELQEQAAEEQRKMDEATYGLTQEQIQQQRLANEQTKRSQQLAASLRLPANFGSMTPQQQFNYYQQRMTKVAGDPELAGETGTLIQNLPRAGFEFAGANLETAKIGLVQAQAAAERDIYHRAMALQGLKNKGQIAAIAARMQGMQEIAKYDAKTKWALAQLAGSIRMQVGSDHDAMTWAIAQLNDQTKAYVAGINPEQSLLNPNYQNPQEPNYDQQSPVTNVYGNQYIGQPTPSDFSQSGGGGGGGGGAQKIAGPQLMQWIGEALKQGKSKQNTDAWLKALVQSGAITQQMMTQMETQYGLLKP